MKMRRWRRPRSRDLSDAWLHHAISQNEAISKLLIGHISVKKMIGAWERRDGEFTWTMLGCGERRERIFGSVRRHWESRSSPETEALQMDLTAKDPGRVGSSGWQSETAPNLPRPISSQTLYSLRSASLITHSFSSSDTCWNSLSASSLYPEQNRLSEKREKHVPFRSISILLPYVLRNCKMVHGSNSRPHLGPTASAVQKLNYATFDLQGKV